MAYFNPGVSTGSTSTLNMVGLGAANALYPVRSTGANISGGGQIFSYCSSHGAADITGVGFFTGVGYGPLGSTGTLHPNIQSKHANAAGVAVGDLLINIESSAGASPGRVTWHCFTNSTWGGSTSIFSSTAGWDATVSVYAST